MCAYGTKTALSSVLPIEIKMFFSGIRNPVEIIDFKNYNKLNPISGIYIFVSDKPIQRLIGNSNILKIGETSNFKRRMSAYFREPDFEKLKLKKGRQTAYRISRYFNSTKNYRLYFMQLNKTELKSKEKELLMLYYEHHYESPPLNMGLR